MNLVQLMMLVVAGVLLGIQFRSNRQEYSVYIGLALCLILLFEAMGRLTGVLAQLEVLDEYLSGEQEYFRILLKVVGITYLCEFASGICKDAGYQAVAGQIEVFGKLTVLLSGMPVILALVSFIRDFAV